MHSDTPILPAHIDDTVGSIAELHADHDRRASLYRRTIEKLIEQLGRPASAGVIAVIMALWIAANVLLERAHRQPRPCPISVFAGPRSGGSTFHDSTYSYVATARKSARGTPRPTNT